MKNLINWFKLSNRNKHFFYGIPAGLFGTILFATGLAVGMEFKDKLYGNKFDIIDLCLTIIGGSIGQLIQLLIIYQLIK